MHTPYDRCPNCGTWILDADAHCHDLPPDLCPNCGDDTDDASLPEEQIPSGYDRGEPVRVSACVRVLPASCRPVV